MKSIRTLSVLAILFAAATLSAPLRAADACSNRGELDQMYCDANKDMVADVHWPLPHYRRSR